MSNNELIQNVFFQIDEMAKDPNADFNGIFDALNSENKDTELVKMFREFLNKVKTPAFLKRLIREIDKHRFQENLDDLIDFLLTCKQDDYEDVNEYVNIKVLCVKAISNYKNIKAVTPLLYCLNDKDENYKMRFAAAEALGKIGDKNAVEPLIDIVADESEKSVYLRESAAIALGMIGDSRALDAFVGILEAKKSFLDKFTFLKERVIESLNKIDFSEDRRVIRVLKQALDDESSQVRINAIESLMNSQVSTASDMIFKMIFDNDQEVRKNAFIALYNIQGEEAFDKILNDDNIAKSLKDELNEVIEEINSEE